MIERIQRDQVLVLLSSIRETLRSKMAGAGF